MAIVSIAAQTFGDWLATPLGIAFAHAVILLVNAITAWVVSRTEHRARMTDKRLDAWAQALTRQIHGGHRHSDL